MVKNYPEPEKSRTSRGPVRAGFDPVLSGFDTGLTGGSVCGGVLA